MALGSIPKLVHVPSRQRESNQLLTERKIFGRISPGVNHLRRATDYGPSNPCRRINQQGQSPKLTAHTKCNTEQHKQPGDDTSIVVNPPTNEMSQQQHNRTQIDQNRRNSHRNRPVNRAVHSSSTTTESNPQGRVLYARGPAGTTPSVPTAGPPAPPAAPVPDPVSPAPMPAKAEETVPVYVPADRRVFGKVAKGLTYANVGSQAIDRYGEVFVDNVWECVAAVFATAFICGTIACHYIALLPDFQLDPNAQIYSALVILVFSLFVGHMTYDGKYTQSRYSRWKHHMEFVLRVHPYIGELALEHTRGPGEQAVLVARRFILEKVEQALSKKDGEKGSIPTYLHANGTVWKCDWTQSSLVAEIDAAVSYTALCNPSVLLRNDMASEFREEWKVVHTVLGGELAGLKVK